MSRFQPAQPVSRHRGLQSLMPYRIREILLLSSRYDSFIFEEEGKITDLILEEYDRLNMRYAPRLNAVTTAEEALARLDSNRRYDLVITTMHPAEMDPADFAREVRQRHPNLPVVLLGYDNRDLQELRSSPDAVAFDHIFIWTGDARILLAIVSLLEDAENVDHDTREVGVEVIVFIEDSIHFISSYLPLLYEQLMRQSQRLISEGVNLSDKVLRMRARPKVLLVSSYEAALATCRRYRPHLLGIISDVSFVRDGRLAITAGIDLTRTLKEESPDVPILLQSSDDDHRAAADALCVHFIDKKSRRLRRDLEHFMLRALGFGPFIFRLPDGREVARADDLASFQNRMAEIPAESFRYHVEHNHFSAWLKARSEFALAAAFRPRQISDYESLEAMRQSIIEAIAIVRREAYRDLVAAFDARQFGVLSRFARIGGGSLGGKARGLAFLGQLMREHGIDQHWPDVDIFVPETVVLGTEIFDRFVEQHALTPSGREPDAAIRARFLAAPLPDDVIGTLRDVVDTVAFPYAVRSSSLLEDSLHQPFAGVYDTYMLQDPGHPEQRLRALEHAIKLVFASTFSANARSYLAATPHRPEKEKMAVIIQPVIGRRHGPRSYPTFSGVAHSYNFYPFGRVRPEDGVARVALGLGRMVMEGRGGLRFCPRYPQHLPEFSSVDDILANVQKTFDALPATQDQTDPHIRFHPATYSIDLAVEDGTIGPMASVYARASHAVYDGMAREGTPLVTFANILKHGTFPLPQILVEILAVAAEAMRTSVELEFAVDLAEPDSGERDRFACLQMRPLAVDRDLSRIDLTAIDPATSFCATTRALGHGRLEGICDIVCITPGEFDRRDSVVTADHVAQLNALLRHEGSPYVLIGPGRWGSADPWLGIPVNWSQISGARIIVETGLPGVPLAPSEGSHFFHNLTAFHVAYLTVDPVRDIGTLDWAWLQSREVVEERPNGLRWLRLNEPMLALIDGTTGQAVLLKSSLG